MGELMTPQTYSCYARPAILKKALTDPKRGFAILRGGQNKGIGNRLDFRMTQANRFISEFCRWAGEGGLPRISRAKLPAALRKAIELKLPERDNHTDVILRPLVSSEGLMCRYDSSDIWVYLSNRKQLLCGTTSPFWGQGWKTISSDEYVADIISDFFHLAAQYVTRGRMTNVVGAIALTYERSCDFRYGEFVQRYSVGPNTPYSTTEAAKNLAVEKYMPVAHQRDAESRKQREFASWVQTINGLDPFIQRGFYQYWKAVALFKANFWEEAITALDGVTSVAAQFCQDRLGVRSNPRQSLVSLLKLPVTDSQQLARLYELRCNFGAHPSQTKWWDLGDIYDDDWHTFRDSAKRTLWRLCKVEAKNRVVKSNPSIWSDWFSKNAEMILDAVWFLRIR